MATKLYHYRQMAQEMANVMDRNAIRTIGRKKRLKNRMELRQGVHMVYHTCSTWVHIMGII